MKERERLKYECQEKNEDDAIKTLNELSLEYLDEKDRKIIIHRLTDNDITTFAGYDESSYLSPIGQKVIKTAIYTQNYLLLKQLLQIRKNNFEQNQQIVQQSQQIIELLTEIKNK